MAKKRLDLWLDEEDKERLQQLADLEGTTVAEVVRRLITERIDADPRIPGAAGAADAVLDMLRIERIRKDVERACGLGMVYSFSRYCELWREDRLPVDADWLAVVYDDTEGQPVSGVTYDSYPIVADKIVDGQHADVVSTCSDTLRCCDIRLMVDTTGDEEDPFWLEIARKQNRGILDGWFEAPLEARWPGEAVKG